MTILSFKQYNDPVDVLEKALVRAKAGEFEALSIAYVCVETGSIGAACTKTKDTFRLYTAIKFAEVKYSDTAFGPTVED